MVSRVVNLLLVLELIFLLVERQAVSKMHIIVHEAEILYSSELMYKGGTFVKQLIYVWKESNEAKFTITAIYILSIRSKFTWTR